MNGHEDLNYIFSDLFLHEDLRYELKRLIKVVSERLDPTENWHGHLLVIKGDRKIVEDTIDKIKRYMREKGLTVLDVRGDIAETRKLIEDIIDADIKNDHDRFKDKVIIMGVDEINEIAKDYRKNISDFHDYISRLFTRAWLSGLLIIVEHDLTCWHGEWTAHVVLRIFDQR